MEESSGDLPTQRAAILSELCCDHVTITNLVEVLRSLVALSDPQEGKLTQSQEKAERRCVFADSVSDCLAGGSVTIRCLSSARVPSSRWWGDLGIPAATGSQASNHTGLLPSEGPAPAGPQLYPPLVSMHA